MVYLYYILEMEHVMKRLISILIILMLVISPIIALPTSAASIWIDIEDKEPVKDYAYSFVVVGDTQIICYKDATKGTNYMSQVYDWIVANKEEKKIEYVFGLGDITDQDWTESGPAEWKVATENIRKLDGVVPYSVVRGNHDREGLFNKAFNDDVYKSQFDGFFNRTVQDSYRTFSVAGDDYLFVTLDHGPSDQKLEWASDIISQYPDRRVIITTHWYTDKNGDPGDVNDYGNAKPIIENHGAEIYNKLVKKHSNIFMVMSGHLNSDGIIVNQKPSPAGNKVTNVLFDTQGMDDADPVGMISIFYFSKDGKTIDIECFSPIKNKYYKENYQFTVSIPSCFQKSNSTTAVTTAATTAATSETPISATAITENTEQSGCKGNISYVSIIPTILTFGVASISHKKRKQHTDK